MEDFKTEIQKRQETSANQLHVSRNGRLASLNSLVTRQSVSRHIKNENFRKQEKLCCRLARERTSLEGN